MMNLDLPLSTENASKNVFCVKIKPTCLIWHLFINDMINFLHHQEIEKTQHQIMSLFFFRGIQVGTGNFCQFFAK